MDSLEDLSRRAAVVQNQPDPNRMRMPSSFVGNGRNLTITVLVAIGLLLLLRAATVLVMAEEAWSWASNQPRLLAMGLPPKTPLPHGPVAISPASWITPADHPQQGTIDRLTGTMMPLLSGTTIASVAVTSDGRVGDCWSTRSSGSLVLDDTACALIERRGHFSPARDARGRAVAALARERVTWRAPRRKAIPFEPYDSLRRFPVTAAGQLGACRQWLDDVELDYPDCSNKLLEYPAVRATVAAQHPAAIVGRTRVVIANAESELPQALPLRANWVPVRALAWRAVVEPDGRLTHCTGTWADDSRPTPCDLGTIVSIPQQEGLPRRRFVSFQDWLGAIPAVEPIRR